MRSTLLSFLIVALVCAASAGSTEKKCVYSDYRLPERLRPEHYDLQLDVDTNTYTYDGKVTIAIEVDDSKVTDDRPANNLPKNVIVLHANANITIDEVQFRKTKTGRTYNAVTDICRDEENELLEISLKKELADRETGELLISFHASVQQDPESLVGFYKNAYTTQSGDTKAILNTHFEPTNAREAFPCFDEPNFKATFDISLVHDPQLVALSNGAVKSEQLKAKRKVTKFKRTPKMSTYLVAFAIGEFEHIERVILGGRVTLRAYTVPGKIKQAEFFLDTAARALPMMEEYFDVPFQMEKIDSLAVPNFKVAGMENWGFILYGEDWILHDDIIDTTLFRGNIAYYCVHELAHQWFGNLVTMHWWTDLWLKEGFATWMGYYFTKQLYPEFEYDFEDRLYNYYITLKTDAEPDIHSISVENVGRDPGAFFDGITYSKTASILSFIHEDYLGPERFREGVRLYIKRNMFGNTRGEDLWAAMKEVSDLPVDELIKSWISQPGHPVVDVDIANEDGSNYLLLKQQRYLPANATNGQRQAVVGQSWIIPISLIASDDLGNRSTIQLVMDSKETQVELPKWFDSERSWVKLNADFRGFYEVSYSRELLFRLEKPCKSKALETLDRIGLVFDSFFGATRRHLSDDELYDIVKWFSDDTEGAIIISLDSAFDELKSTGFDKQRLSEMRDLLGESYIKIYRQQGLTHGSDELSVSDGSAKKIAMLHLAKSGYKPFVKEALKKYDEEGYKVKGNIREAVYLVVNKFGTDEQKKRLYEYADQEVLDEIDSSLDALNLDESED